MSNRISNYEFQTSAPGSFLPSGFAVCPLAQGGNNPLAIQLLAQQQAYEQALVAAREDALRIALSRLQTSLN